MVSAVTVTVSTWRLVMRMEARSSCTIAAQSIEPGTQLTTRTFHTGLNTEATQGLPRV